MQLLGVFAFAAAYALAVVLGLLLCCGRPGLRLCKTVLKPIWAGAVIGVAALVDQAILGHGDAHYVFEAQTHGTLGAAILMLLFIRPILEARP